MGSIAILIGATAIGFAPIFAKLAVDYDRGSPLALSPTSAAFWRLSLSCPIFWLLYLFNRRRRVSSAKGFSPIVFLPGLFFALDLSLWHWSFEFTSLANSSLEVNLSIVVVAVLSYFIFGEKLTSAFVVGSAIAFAGLVGLVGADFQVSDDKWFGDLLGLATALCYGSYLLAVKVAATRVHVSLVMALATTTASVLILLQEVIIFSGHIFPQTWQSWLSVGLLALVSQVGGQGVIAWGMTRVKASYAAILLLIQPVVTALMSWVILEQELSSLQLLAMCLMLFGIHIAKKGVATDIGKSVPTPNC